MTVLQFMGDHPILTLLLALLAYCTVVESVGYISAIWKKK
jgi:hypothetical protein